MIDKYDDKTMDLLSDLTNAASCCESVLYRYDNMLECVKEQSPFLLNRCERLGDLARQVEELLQLFEEEVRRIAADPEYSPD